MINITDKASCCGCKACANICTKNAITFTSDIEGFWYPKVSQDKCTNCGLCEKVCPQLNINLLKKNDSNKPIRVMAAVNKNMRIRWNSTSGGAYSALADTMLENGGFVSGAIYEEGFTGVQNYVTNNPHDMDELRSSKYLQSDPKDIYIRIKKLLNEGKKVLACGTPCQMAALRSFLSYKEYENLIIVDFVCRGVNSPKVYRSYLDSLENKYNSKIVYIKAKNKELGWRNLTRKIVFANGQSYYGVHMQDDFRRGYHTNVYCRPSCYNCVFKGFPRISDITIADYWGIEKINKNLDMNIGTSMVLINSKKGERYYELIKDKLEFVETEFETILAGNIALTKPINSPSINRELFFQDLESHDFDYVTKKYFPRIQPENKIALRSKIRKFIYSKVNHLINRIKRTNEYIIIHRSNTNCNGNKIKIDNNVTLDIHPTARINVHAPITIGCSEIKGFSYPTAIRMDANTELTFNNGPLTRYKQYGYTMRTGACIEIVNGGKLTIGQGACNVNLTIMCTKEITIGNGVRIGRNVSIRDFNGIHVIVNDTYKNYAPVHIGDHCWLCTGCTIMPGVTIGEGVVVAANATVTKNVPPHSLVAGNPAKIIKENIEWY